jgi:DNA repair exonuclease SbcCD ATPase subunit
MESEPEAAVTLAEPVAAQTPEPLFAPVAEAESSLPHARPFFEAPRQEEHESAEETREPADTAPAFAHAVEESAKPQRRWIGIAAGLAAGLALGLFAGQARSHSQPAPPPAPAPVAAPLSRTAPAAPSPQDAALRKRNDELSRQVVDLSQQNTDLKKQNSDLSTQQASLAKQDAELNKVQGEAGKRQSELRQQRDDLLKQTAKLKADLTTQTAHAQALQQQVEDLRRQQQKKRLSIQSSDPLP